MKRAQFSLAALLCAFVAMAGFLAVARGLATGFPAYNSVRIHVQVDVGILCMTIGCLGAAWCTWKKYL
jgi:hypothetical protein